MAITSHCITQSQTRKALLSCPVSVLAHETPILYDHPPPEQPPIMLFKREKHGAPVRRDFSHMVQKCKKAVAESSSATAVVSVPNLRSKAPTHHQVFWLMQPGADRKNKIHAPRGFLPSHGLPPTMAAFRRKAAQLQIQLRGKPRILTGFLLIPPPRSAAAKGTMIRCILFYVQNTTPGSNCQCLFPSLPLFRDVHPKIRIERNPLRRQAPKWGGCGFWPAPG